MITQVVLHSDYLGSYDEVYWLQHCPYEGQILKTGQKVSLAENPYDWTIKALCVSVPDDTALPPKARTGTILKLD